MPDWCHLPHLTQMWSLRLLPTANQHPHSSLGMDPVKCMLHSWGSREGGSGGMEVAGSGLSECGSMPLHEPVKQSVHPLSAAPMAQQLPPLTKFSGDAQGAG